MRALSLTTFHNSKLYTCESIILDIRCNAASITLIWNFTSFNKVLHYSEETDKQFNIRHRNFNNFFLHSSRHIFCLWNVAAYYGFLSWLIDVRQTISIRTDEEKMSNTFLKLINFHAFSCCATTLPRMGKLGRCMIIIVKTQAQRNKVTNGFPSYWYISVNVILLILTRWVCCVA